MTSTSTSTGTSTCLVVRTGSISSIPGLDVEALRFHRKLLDSLLDEVHPKFMKTPPGCVNDLQRYLLLMAKFGLHLRAIDVGLLLEPSAPTVASTLLDCCEVFRHIFRNRRDTVSLVMALFPQLCYELRVHLVHLQPEWSQPTPVGTFDTAQINTFIFDLVFPAERLLGASGDKLVAGLHQLNLALTIIYKSVTGCNP